MIAFFFTMPISRMMPISPMTSSCMWKSIRARMRSRARRRQSRENRDGMDVALVQHAQHDVDRQQSGQDQDRLRRERILEGRRGSLEAAVNRCRHAQRELSLINGARCRAQVAAGRQIERDGHAGELSLVIHRERRVAGLEMREGRQRHLRAGAGDHVHALQRVRRRADTWDRPPSPRDTGSASDRWSRSAPGRKRRRARHRSATG